VAAAVVALSSACQGAGLRLHVIALSNSDGSNANTVKPNEFAALVERVNLSFANTGLRFLFDPVSDWMEMADDDLNIDGPKQRQRGNEMAARWPHKVVCLLRWSPGGNGNAYPPPGVNPKPPHVNDEEQNYVALPNQLGVLSQLNGSFIAHEMGHYLGLYHTFPGWHDSTGPVYGSGSSAEKAVIDYIAARGGGIGALDGDSLGDTPPDPSPVLYAARGQDICSKRSITVSGEINDKPVRFTFAPNPDNVMSYFGGCPNGSPRSFTSEQIHAMRRTLAQSGRRALLLNNWLPLKPADTLGRFFAPEDALIIGQDWNLAPLHSCRGERSDGSTHPGSFRSGSSEGCAIGYGSQQENVKSFDILTTTWAGNLWDTGLKSLVYKSGDVPDDAVQGGLEASGEKLYYCRARVGGSWQPGKIRRGFGACNVPYGGREIPATPYQVLIWLTTRMPLSKVAAANGAVPSDALRGGIDIDGQALYICSAVWNGGTHPGKLKANSGACLIPYGGLERPVVNYDVLVTRWVEPSPLDSTGVSFRGGTDTDREALGVCRARLGPANIPGKYKPSARQCYIGINGSAVAPSSFQVLTGRTSRVPGGL
jgi:hypothetical protein